MTDPRLKDQTHCPKCGRLFCEGYWGEGVCTADMHFGNEPTARGDAIADYIRQWYELHRESWRDRHQILLGRAPDRSGVHADEFMLAFISEVRRVTAEAERQTST